MRGVKIIFALALSSIPVGYGSSLLEAKVDSSYCTGNLTLDLISASCGNESCTYGSEVALYGQVNATTNLPRHAKVSVYPSIPLMAFTGIFSIYEQETSNICANATQFTPPAGDDAGYHCPKAGLYNVHSLFTMWGSPDAWWSSLYGFNIVFIVKIEDANDNEEYASCYLEAKVKDGDGGISTSTGFLGIVGLSGLAAGLMLRKRKNKISEPDVNDHEHGHDHFELITEPASRV